MRFVIDADHRQFFSKNGFIVFENLFPLDQLASLKNHAEETIAKRLRTAPTELYKKTGLEIYQAGHDLWRDSETMRKITHKQTFAEIAGQLFQTVSLRCGFDQYFSMGQGGSSPYPTATTLQEASCIEPLAGALLFPITDLSEPLPFFPLPVKAGDALMIAPSFSIPWPQLFGTAGLSFFLIAFAMEKAYFREGTQDTHAVFLKKLGYAYNSALEGSLHPIVLRKH